MQKVKAVFLSASLAILCGAGLIWGNQILASNILAAGNQTEPAIVISETAGGSPVSEEQLSNVWMYSNADGKVYMAPKNYGSLSEKQEVLLTTAEDNTSALQNQNPIKGNLSEEEAKQIGIKAIAEKYGLTKKEISAFDVTVRARYSSPLPVNIANMRPSLTVAEEAPATEADMQPSAETDVLVWTVMLTPVNQEDFPTIMHYRAMFDDKSLELMDVHAIPLIKEGTPLGNEISSDKAKEIAITALTKKYALTQKTLDRFTVTIKYYEVTDEAPGKHVWWVNLYPTIVEEFSEIGCYWSYIDAETGEPLQLNSAADGKG